MGGAGAATSGQPQAPSGGLLGSAGGALATRDKYNAYVMQSQEQGVKPMPHDQWAKKQTGLLK